MFLGFVGTVNLIVIGNSDDPDSGLLEHMLHEVCRGAVPITVGGVQM
jgi:hypothetical protein